MKKLASAVLAAMLALGCALAHAESDPVLDMARAMAEDALADMRADASGWTALMLEGAQITSVEYGQKSVYVRVSVPTLESGVTSRETPDGDAKAYLDKAYAPYLTRSATAELLLNATYSTKDGETTMKWSGMSNPRNFISKLKGLAAKAKKSFTGKQMRLAVAQYLLPKAAEMPKKQPETMPAMASLTDYTSQVAQALSLTPEQAELRLPCLLMLTELTGIDAAEPLDAAVLTVKVKDWQAMLDAAAAGAQTALDSLMGVPDMSRLDYEKVLSAQLPAACLEAYYVKKGAETQQLTVALDAAVRDGPQAAQGLMDFFSAYSAAVEEKLDALMTYGATLPYYPRVELIDAGVLTGAEDAQGQRVTFDMGGNQTDHGYVNVTQDGESVLTGFVRSGVRLTVRLAKGDYVVYYTAGPEWYGESYLFGKEAAFGKFSLHVGDADRLVVHLEDTGGELAVEAMDWDSFPHPTPASPADASDAEGT